MLPFLAGLAVGGAAVVAFSNKKELKEVAQKGYEKSKEVASDIKKVATSTAKNVKEKIKGEEKPEAKKPVAKKTTRKTTASKTTTAKKPVAKKTTTRKTQVKKTPEKTTDEKA